MNVRPRKSATGRGRSGVSRLLQIVGNQPWATQDDHAETIQKKAPPKIKKEPSPVPIDADPMSFSDFERNSDDSSSDDEQPDIPSSFPKKKPKPSSPAKPQQSGRQRRSRPSNLAFDGSCDEPSAKRAKMNSRKSETKATAGEKVFRTVAPLPELPKLEYDDFGNPIRNKPFKKASRPKTYGSSAIKKEFVKPKTELDLRPKGPQKEFRMPGQLPTPSSSGEKKSASQSSSQHSEGVYEHSNGLIDAPEQDEDEPQSQASVKTTEKASDPPSSAPTKSQEAPKFRMINESLSQAVNRLDPKIVEEERRKRREEEERAAELAARLPDQGPCPMNCGKILSRSELDKLSMTATIKEQQQFCRRHQIADAEQTWKERKYPKLDWKDFPERLEGYESTITRLFERPDNLHFRKKMAERIKSGKSRNLLQQMKNEGLDSLGVGYYGARGHDMMTNHISKTFARELRERAVHDRVMSAQGAMAYVQEVLVPELATVLIKEDMNVPDGEARRIMSASNDIGDLLHPSASSAASKKKKTRA